MKKLEKFARPLAIGVLENEYIDFWLIGYTPPSPSAGNLAWEDGLLALGPISPKAPWDSFFPILEASWSLPRHDVFLSSIFYRKNGKF